MNTALRRDADEIVRASLAAVLPDTAVQRALKDYAPGDGRTLLVAVGKAAWQMAKAALDTLGQVDDGVVITKYDHVKGELPGVRCYEAGHPVPDENSFNATKKALDLVQGLSAKDTVIFLLSGGCMNDRLRPACREMSQQSTCRVWKKQEPCIPRITWASTTNRGPE